MLKTFVKLNSHDNSNIQKFQTPWKTFQAIIIQVIYLFFFKVQEKEYKYCFNFTELENWT